MSLRRHQPQVPYEYVRLVLGALGVEEFRICFPVKPAIIEWPVGVAKKAVLCWPATHEQRITYRAADRTALSGVRITRWIASGYLLMGQIRIEVVGDPCIQTVEVDID